LKNEALSRREAKMIVRGPAFNLEFIRAIWKTVPIAPSIIKPRGANTEPVARAKGTRTCPNFECLCLVDIQPGFRELRSACGFLEGRTEAFNDDAWAEDARLENSKAGP